VAGPSGTRTRFPILPCGLLQRLLLNHSIPNLLTVHKIVNTIFDMPNYSEPTCTIASTAEEPPFRYTGKVSGAGEERGAGFESFEHTAIRPMEYCFYLISIILVNIYPQV
jgi:hypothetical protein